MAKSKVNVSPEFSKFYGKHATAIDEAKKAENTMSSGPCPTGWEGKCTLVEITADQGKDKKDDKGNIISGNPRIKMKFIILDDPKFEGKTFQKYWVFYKSANMDEIGRYQMFLNDAERMGLPRDLRENHDSPQELLTFFEEAEIVFDVKCEHDDYSSDKKKMVISAPVDALDDSPSMMPETTKSVITSSAPEYAVGDKVIFLNNEWTIVERKEDDLVIERQDGDRLRTRDCKVTAVKPA